MSVRFDSGNDRVTRSANLPAWDSYTFCGFIQLVSDTGGQQSIFALVENGSSYHVLETVGAGNTQLHLYSGFGIDLNTGVTLSIGTWYFVVVVHSGTTVKTRVMPVGGSFTDASTADAIARTFASMELMGNQFSEFPDARGMGFRWWAAELDDTETLAESASLLPVRTANLAGHYLFGADEVLQDFSGLGRTLTNPGGAGEWETEENPPGITAFTADLASTISGPTSSMEVSVAVSAMLDSTISGPTSSMDAATGPAVNLASIIGGPTSSMEATTGLGAELASVIEGPSSSMDVAVGASAELASVISGPTSSMEVIFHDPRTPSATMVLVPAPTATVRLL